MKRTGWAVWQGGLKEGKGTLSTESRALANATYSHAARFNGEPGTNPEELIAAAHAGCFSMALAAEMARAGMNATSVRTTAIVTMEHTAGAWTVTLIHLAVTANCPGASPHKFDSALSAARTNCPISRLLNTQIEVVAHLEARLPSDAAR